LIVWGTDRAAALRSLRKALNEYQVVGPATNLEFLGRLAANEAFGKAEVDTAFIPVRPVVLLVAALVGRARVADTLASRSQRHYDSLFPPLPPASASTLGASALFLAERERAHFASLGHQSAWTDSKLAAFRSSIGSQGEGRYWREYELAGVKGKGEAEGNDVLTTVKVGPSLQQDSSAPEGALDVELTPSAGSADAAAEAVLFSNVSPELAPSSLAAPNATTLLAHLASTLSRVDIVSAPPPAIASTPGDIQGETLHLFNGAEAFAGAVKVVPPSWMSKVGAAAGGGAAAKGGARAPMRASIFFSLSSSCKTGSPDTLEPSQRPRLCRSSSSRASTSRRVRHSWPSRR